MSQLIEKKNRQMYFDGANEHQRFGIRKLTIGAASVLLGATLFLGGHAQEAHADTLNTSAPMENNTSTGEEAASQELNNASQDNVPTNPTVEQAETPSAGTTQSQPASVTSETQSANMQSSQASQDQSATLNTYNANQVAQSVNATSTINSQVQNASTQAQGQIPEANYAQASQDQSAVLNANNANQGASQVQSNTLNNNVANNTQEAANTSSMLANQVVQNNTNVTNVNSATNTSQNNLAINNTQDYVPNNPTNNKAKINYDALNKANKQANLVLNQPQALHAANLAMNAQNSVLRLSRNLKDNLNNVDNSKLKLFENNLMALRNTNPYLVSLASTGDDDVDISFPDDGNENQNITPQPGEHYDTTQGVKTVTRNIEWYIIKADGETVQTGHTVTDKINFYEPHAKDDQGQLLPEYSWAHWNSSLNQHFTDRARETEQILRDNNNIRLDHVDGGTSADVAGETLITPNSSDQNIKVYFKEGKISTLVRFLDADPNNGRDDGDQVVLSSLSIEGPQSAYINDPNQLNEIRTTLQNYLKQGYKVQDGGNPFSPQIDGDSHVDPNAVEPNTEQYRTVDGSPDNTAINIMLDHDSRDFGPDTPNPKTGKKDENTQSVVHRIISYVYEDGSPVMDTNNQPAKATQTLTFSRQADVDMVTGKVIYAPWGDPGTFEAIPSPALDGYTPDTAVVPETTVNAESPDIHVTVTYKKNVPIKKDASGQINYIDDDNSGNVIKTDNFNGKVGDPINYSTQPTINNLTNKGYEFVSDNFGTTSHIFQDGDNNYEVHFKHSLETVKPGNEKTPGTPINPNDPDPNGPKWPDGTDKNSVERTGKRTVNYTGANSQTPQPKVDTISFTRQVVVDKVTGQITSATDWQPASHQFDSVKTPFINYFYADKLYAGNLSVSPSNLEVTDLVTYNPMANIIPVDESHHKIPNVPNPQYTTDPQNPTKATPNQLVPNIQNMVPDQNTVTPINPGQPTEVVYREIKIPAKRKAARLIFKLNNTNTPNITDLHQIRSLPTMMTDGTSGSPMNDKTIPDVYTVDSSGVISGPGYGDTSQWRAIASANGVDLDAPAKAGYTWKIAKITGTDTSQDIYFVYSKAPEQSSLKVVVHDNTTNQDLPQYGYDHKDAPGTTVDYDWPTQKQHLLDNGYKIVNEPVVPSTIPNKPQTVTITVEHDIVPDNNTDHKHTPDTPINPNNPTGPKWPAKDNFTKDYTYTVNFNDQNGNKVADPQHQVSTWNRTIYVDKVTGEIKQDQSTPWTPDKPNYDNTNVPVINGYVASKTSKNGSPVSNILPGPKTEQKDTTDTVTYSTVGKIVPVDPNGNPISGAEQPKYINDPNDPTKVTPNEKVPTIKGKTPETPTITPQDPTKDTKVVYHDNAIDTSLKVIIHDKTTNQDLPNYGYNSGTVHAGDKVPYTFDQDRQKLIDHGYKIDDVPVIPTVYGKTPQTITITVEHDVAPDNNTDHKHTPGTPINPKDPTGSKWPAKDNFTKDYTYTVNFNDQNGNKVADPQHQVSTWNRTIYVDKVTGEIKQDQSTPWTPDKPNYSNTNVPVINGYVASKTSKNGSPVSNILPGPKTEQKDTTDTVTYSTVGKIVPVDPNGNPIPGAEQPKYINDPKDPTKVTPNEKVPVLPGKTPRQTSVTPVSPTKDTHVIYDDDAVDTSLKVIVHDQTDNRDLTGYGFNSGTVKSGTRVPYTFDQDRQKLIDHGYEIVNVPAIPTVYGKKPQTVTITVKHAVAPVNNQDHKHTPGTPINPNDSIGPKWPAKDNYSQDHTYTVNFSSPDGKQLADPKTQTSHWNRTLNIDKVTGKILNPNEPWKSDITNYQDTKVPVINGYVANKTSKNGSPVSKILPGAKAVPSDITDTVQYSKIGRIIPVDLNGKPIPGASTPMYENDPDDPTKVKRTDVPYIKGYTPSVDSVDPKDPTKDTDVVYQKDQPDIVPDNPNENLPSVPNDSDNDLGDFKTPKKDTKKVPAKKKIQDLTKQAPVNNNTKQPVNNNAGLANKAKIPAANVAQAATLPNKAVANQAPTNNAKKALPQTGEDQNDLMILAVGSLLSAMSLATLAGTRRKRKRE